MDDIRVCYELLGLKPGVSEKEVKQAYRDLVKIWHPDRFGSDPRLQQKAQEKLKEINNAYEKIKKDSSTEEQIFRSESRQYTASQRKSSSSHPPPNNMDASVETESHPKDDPIAVIGAFIILFPLTVGFAGFAMFIIFKELIIGSLTKEIIMACLAFGFLAFLPGMWAYHFWGKIKEQNLFSRIWKGAE